MSGRFQVPAKMSLPIGLIGWAPRGGKQTFLQPGDGSGRRVQGHDRPLQASRRIASSAPAGRAPLSSNSALPRALQARLPTASCHPSCDLSGHREGVCLLLSSGLSEPAPERSSSLPALPF